jgi:hypothetical protein
VSWRRAVFTGRLPHPASYAVVPHPYIPHVFTQGEPELVLPVLQLHRLGLGQNLVSRYNHAT